MSLNYKVCSGTKKFTNLTIHHAEFKYVIFLSKDNRTSCFSIEYARIMFTRMTRNSSMHCYEFPGLQVLLLGIASPDQQGLSAMRCSTYNLISYHYQVSQKKVPIVENS